MKELIHFTADWCAPCKIITPIIEEFIENNKDIYYDKVDVDKEFGKAELYNVQSVPTLISKIDGRTHDRVSGVVSEFTLKSMFS